MGLRITTWNVNGIRNPFGYQPWSSKRTFDAMFEILEADIVVMQELKIQRKDLKDDMVLVPGWDCFFSLPKHKKGYSGVGIYIRQAVCQPIRAEEGLLGVLCPPGSSTPYRELPADDSIGGYLSYSEMADLGVDPAVLDAEGRCVVLEFPAFVIFGVYCPANTRGDDAGTMFRHAFWEALDKRIRKLDAMGKRIILAGDLNNAVCELDIAGSEEDKRKEGISHEEFISTPRRRILNQLLDDGEVIGARDKGREKSVLWDVCRAFHPKRQGMYTHWDTKKNMRPGNFGSRIDYLLMSISMKSWITDSNIQEGLLGSDHCPVYAVMNDIVTVDGSKIYLKDMINPPGVFKEGERLKDIPEKPTLAFSARLLPEFDVSQRQSIKDMFTRQPSISQKLNTTSSSNSPDASASKSTGSSMQVMMNSSSTAQSLQKADLMKRKTSDSDSGGGKTKRFKSIASTTPAHLGKGQGTLRSFFTPKASFQPSTSAASAASAAVIDSSSDHVSSIADARMKQLTSDKTAAAKVSEEAPPTRIDASKDARDSDIAIQVADDTQLSDIVEKRAKSSEQWGMLMRKPSIPLCEGHEEPCKSLQTKKKGVNCGRMFYICARPLGPSGEKEKNTQWRCGTFIWASDWQGGAGNSR
ncbi:hypothetical protein, variant [Verruconis gallopava]|uniref:DNA-(apurinic or apyrimidinic site) endonuclease 2 n=1 Tax=Verruconis gallopava TaxID=253628 RepID=A0A0D1Z4J1_9PEZI|nr:hypothetical protein, variant [Verruconis gallopava]KIW07887.1 hypothetical protein, variant [Verruconis gallopava]